MFFLIRQNETIQIFEGILFFRVTNNTKTNNLATASWALLEGCAHKTDIQMSADTFPNLPMCAAVLENEVPFQTFSSACPCRRELWTQK